MNGNLSKENFLRLYKSELMLNSGSKMSVTYNKPSADDQSVMQAGIIFEDQPAVVVKVPLPDSGKKTAGWVTKELDLSAYAGKKSPLSDWSSHRVRKP